jgi:hypothetical protein
MRPLTTMERPRVIDRTDELRSPDSDCLRGGARRWSPDSGRHTPSVPVFPRQTRRAEPSELGPSGVGTGMRGTIHVEG